MRQKKQITKATKLNYNMKTLIKEFGYESNIVRAAQDYLESRADSSFLKYDKNNEIVGIKDSKDLPESIFGRSYTFNEFIPSAREVYKREILAVKEDLKYQETLTEEEQAFIKKNQKQILSNTESKQFLRARAEEIAADLNDYEGIRDDIYSVRDNDEGLEENAWIYINDAEVLIQEREQTAEWVRRARELVRAYTETVEQERRLKEYNR